MIKSLNWLCVAETRLCRRVVGDQKEERSLCNLDGQSANSHCQVNGSWKCSAGPNYCDIELVGQTVLILRVLTRQNQVLILKLLTSQNQVLILRVLTRQNQVLILNVFTRQNQVLILSVDQTEPSPNIDSAVRRTSYSFSSILGENVVFLSNRHQNWPRLVG